MKKVLVITTSPHVDGNSETMARWFEAGAQDAHHKVKFVRLLGKNISFCTGCMKCQKTHRCVIEDDAVEICNLMHDADVVVWATPIYFYNVSGQMKTMMDRTNPLYGGDYHFTEVYLLAAAAEDAPTTAECATRAVQGWVDCFERATFKKMFFAGGLKDRWSIDRPQLDPIYQYALTI